jgi:hypothetical protein
MHCASVRYAVCVERPRHSHHDRRGLAQRANVPLSGNIHTIYNQVGVDRLVLAVFLPMMTCLAVTFSHWYKPYCRIRAQHLISQARNATAVAGLVVVCPPRTRGPRAVAGRPLIKLSRLRQHY